MVRALGVDIKYKAFCRPTSFINQAINSIVSCAILGLLLCTLKHWHPLIDTLRFYCPQRRLLHSADCHRDFWSSQLADVRGMSGFHHVYWCQLFHLSALNVSFASYWFYLLVLVTRSYLTVKECISICYCCYTVGDLSAFLWSLYSIEWMTTTRTLSACLRIYCNCCDCLCSHVLIWKLIQDVLMFVGAIDYSVFANSVLLFCCSPNCSSFDMLQYWCM